MRESGSAALDNPAVGRLARLGETLNGAPRTAQLKELAQGLNRRAANGMPASMRGPANATGIPDSLKTGVEALSGLALNDVRVHRNSTEPAALQAHAFTRGSDIHVAPGQERHLAHEAWHVVQQKQGRVRPTMQLKGGVAVNDDAGLEREADAMGAKAARWRPARPAEPDPMPPAVVPQPASPNAEAAQLVIAGLEDIEATAQIPDAWVTAYIDDITNPETHLYDEDLVAYLDDHDENWHAEAALTPSEDHWDVTLAKEGMEPIRVTTLADGSCGAYAVYAISNRADIEKSVDQYGAPADFVTAVRTWIQDRNRANEDEVRERILQEIRQRDEILLTGFGPQLQALLRARVEAAERSDPLTDPISSGSPLGTESDNIIINDSSAINRNNIIDNSDSNASPSEDLALSTSSADVGAVERARGLMAAEGRSGKESDRLAAIRFLNDLRDRMEYFCEYRGAYSEVWADPRHRFDNALTWGMRFLKILGDDVMELCGSMENDDLTEPEAARIVSLATKFYGFAEKLGRAQSMLQQGATAKKGKDTDEKKLQDMAAGQEIANKDFRIPSGLYNKLAPLVKAYMPAWDKVGTDGLKGIKYEDVAAVEQLRQRIAAIVLAYPSVDMDVVIGFAEQLRALASQSCASRDVQNFEGWFKKHK